MSGSFNQQNYAFNDGDIQTSYSSQQYSWSSTQEDNSTQTPIQAPLPSMPQMLPAPDFGQFHNQHMALHHASMQSAFQAQQNMMNAMQAGMNRMPQLPLPAPQQQAQLMPPQHQAQIEYPQSLVARLPAPEAQQISVARPPHDRLEMVNQVVGEVNRGAAKLDERMRRLEESQACDREELARARKENQQLQQQRLEDEQRHSREMANSKQSHATSPAFDIAALRKIIEEVRTDRISKNDIKQLVEDAVGKQLSGVAKISAIDSAASRMERGLNRVPTGASAIEVQQAVQQELAKAVEKVARHMPTQQRSLEGPSQPTNLSWQQRNPAIETQFIVEELPEDEDEQQQHVTNQYASQSTRKPGSLPAPPVDQHSSTLTATALATLPGASSSGARHSKSRASVLPTAENALVRSKQMETHAQSSTNMSVVSERLPKAELPGGSQLTEKAISRLQLEAGPEPSSSKSRHSKSRASVAPSADNALARVKQQDSGHSRSSKKSTVSVQPSAHNSMVRAKSSDGQTQMSSAHAIAMAQTQGGKLSEYAGNQGFEDLPDDFPDNASQVSAWQRKRDSAPSMSDKSTVVSIRPKNDRRSEVKQSPLRQVEAAPGESESGMALVKHSYDVSKKSRR